MVLYEKSFTYVSAAQTTLDGLPWWIVLGPVAGGGSGTKSRGQERGKVAAEVPDAAPAAPAVQAPQVPAAGADAAPAPKTEQSFLVVGARVRCDRFW